MESVRTDGITVVPWRSGKLLIWDVMCQDIFAPSYSAHATREVGAVAALAEEREVTKYVHLTPVHLFSPIIVETMGVFGPHTKALLKDRGRRLTQTTGEDAATTYLFQRLSVPVQQSNCASVMAPQANSILAFSIDQIDGPLVSVLTVCSAHHLENTLILLL